MLAGALGKVVATVVTVVVGGAVAGVTVYGLVTSQVDSSASNPANVDNPSISYGSNG